MNCVECGNTIQSNAKFCGGCGTNLMQQASYPSRNRSDEAATRTAAAPQPAGNSQQYLEKGKTISRLYFSYFLTVLKKPVPTAEKIDRNELTNGLITMALFSLMIPLMTYFGLKNALGIFGQEIPFGSAVIKPFFVIFVFIALVGVIIFASIKVGKSSASLLDVLSRLGAFLVVPTVLLATALVISLIGSFFSAFFLLLGLLGFSFIIPLIVYSFKREEPNGLDAFYCTFLTYIGIGILFVIMGEQALQEIERIIGAFDPFGF